MTCYNALGQFGRNLANNFSCGKFYPDEVFEVKRKTSEHGYSYFEQDVNKVTRRVVSYIALALLVISVLNSALNLQFVKSAASSNFVVSAYAEGLTTICLGVLSITLIAAAAKNTVYGNSDLG